MDTRTLALPDATLTFDVRGELAPGVTPLMLIGSPMDANGFTTLASHFADRVVITYDPRNTGRSLPADATAAVTPRQHAGDLHALIESLACGPVDIFASSGGAVNGLDLVTRHPDDVRTLVAHEPPAGGTLPDREHLRQVCSNMVATYDANGLGPAMAEFIALVMHRGPIDDAYLAQPAPEPAAFGMSDSDDGSRTDPFMANMRGGGANLLPTPTRSMRRPPASSSASAKNPAGRSTAKWPVAQVMPWQRCWGSTPPSSPAATQGSPVANSAKQESPPSLQQHCARCSGDCRDL